MQSLRYLPQSLQSITNEATRQFSTKTNSKQIRSGKVRNTSHSSRSSSFVQREIDRKVIAAAEQAFNIRIESLFNGISNEGREKSVLGRRQSMIGVHLDLRNLSMLPASSSSSSCLSCQVGITQHLTHKDLLKVESLGT